MYAGHAALALLAKSRRTPIPLAVLVIVAYAPDWLEWMLGGIHDRGTELSSAALISHSIVLVLIGSAVVAGLALAIRLRPVDAVLLGALYLSHWVVDLITGLKPTWSGGPMIGLRLYDTPLWDFVLESVVIVACWMAYRRSLPATSRRGWTVVILVGLIVLQAGFAVVVRQMS